MTLLCNVLPLIVVKINTMGPQQEYVFTYHKHNFYNCRVNVDILKDNTNLFMIAYIQQMS